jgi:hypothetical protein
MTLKRAGQMLSHGDFGAVQVALAAGAKDAKMFGHRHLYRPRAPG